MSKRYFIFLCSNETLPEVLDKKLVGHRFNKYKPMTELISKDDFFLLYNYDSKVLIDILKATGEVGINKPLEPSAFKHRFPFQAKFDYSIIPKELKERPLPKEKILKFIRFNDDYPQFVITTQEFNLIIKAWSEYSKIKTPFFGDYNQRGYIFLCDNTTAGECFDKKIFGASDSKWIDFIRKIPIGSICFLWNYQKKELYGIFKTTSLPYYDHERRNFRGQYPAQVMIDWVEKFSTGLTENEVRTILNFTSYPQMEIDSKITQKIINTFHKKQDFVNIQSQYIADDGHIVKSQAELLIDNFLYSHNLIHAYGIRVPINETVIFTDFYLPEGDVYIEYWGGLSSQTQENIKKNWYREKGKNLINIYKGDIQSGLSDKLKLELLNFGYSFR